ncbi:OB-fold domain-containing protein [Papillibacter cinnamivorans]|uniref:OB-fold domain-containing protein n=1 Tax=Papillibacter cinnamivorans TaxID=100176 RepID=UPI000A015BBF|nr:OB-fold domain-containing protein [Papillibacter cinnamivorans]
MKNPTIYTYSVLYSSFGPFVNKVPYVSAILEQEDGSRFPSLLEGFAPEMKIRVGQEVFRLGKNEQGLERYSLLEQ